jgi:Xaa-Pro aminopeptidase
MKYNVRSARTRWGLFARDFEVGINYDQLRRDRFQRAQAAVKKAGLGAVLAFDMENIRYITGTYIGDVFRDFLGHYCICPKEGDSFLFDLAVPAKRISAPWMGDRMEPPISSLKGSLAPEMGFEDRFAKQIKRVLSDYGVEKELIGIDICLLPALRALEKEGLKVVDGQQAMLEARKIKLPAEIEIMKQLAAITDGVHDSIARAIRPGVRESEIVALASNYFYKMGCERVSLIQCVTGPRGIPHCHTPSDRIITPGDIVFVDPLATFMGYRNCYYRCFCCGKPNRYQVEAYEKASKWLSDAIDAVKPGATTAEVAAKWPKAQDFNYRNEDEAFLQQYGHAIGLGLWEPPIISRRFMDKPTKLEEGMVIAVETYCMAEDGSGAARIEEEIVVTKDGCELLTNYPSDHLISCGLPDCEIY